ncbi:type II secretion system F family protein [Gleimia hominis]|uniref:Type II secretion system F family protein n=1 Tax=Gleimia hominis TaxID=595468 RepID=A0ABU3IAA3_9ACTO|nr:type II secretion system F family protein [Gleimia hominis]MDT3767314.1 type II secretion system F family protein [Gleimia hominis]
MIIILSVLFTVGVLSVYSALTARSRLLIERVLGGQASSRRVPFAFIRVSGLWAVFGSPASSVQERLELTGEEMTVQQFRVRQLIAAVLAAAVATSLLVIIAAMRPVSVIQWLILVSISFVVGAALYDKWLTWRVSAVARKVGHQVADSADLLALAISAGESIPGALSRVSRACGRELRLQLERALEDIEGGMSVTRALGSLSSRTNSPQLSRLLDTLVMAAERGAPLALVLREQARDLRDESRRALMESGGRKEIAMLVPVVFLILPVVVLFALYPGLVALKL